MKPLLRLMIAIAATAWLNVDAVAAAYTGTAPACTALSTGTCRIDMLDFMRSKYSYQGFTANSDNVADTTANSFRAVLQRQHYDPVAKTFVVENQPADRMGFGKHPTLPNGFMAVAGQTPTKSLSYFVWGASNDNSIYVLSEISYQNASSRFKTFSSTNTPDAPGDWQNRGYFWTEKRFDVSPLGNGTWVATDRTRPVNAWFDFNLSGILQSAKYDPYNPDVSSSGRVKAVTSVKFYANMSDASVINQFGGSLPMPLEVVEVKYSALDSAGTIRFWEKYYYGRQRLANGTYNSFGMIKYQSALFDSAICQGGQPTALHPTAKCDPTASNLYILWETPISTFASHNVASWFSQALGSRYPNDLKFTRRTAADSYGNVAETSTRPPNRGGFRPQGPGNDSTNSLVLDTDWVYMENAGADQDVYLYADGQDPLSPTQPTPANYCRDGYSFVGSVVTPQSYSIAKYGGGIVGDWAYQPATGSIGTTYPATAGNHWIAFCAATNTSGPLMYINATNSGEASCTTGYTSRLWYNANHAGVGACPGGANCFDGAAKNYINFCVKSSECVGACMGTTNP